MQFEHCVEGEAGTFNHKLVCFALNIWKVQRLVLAQKAPAIKITSTGQLVGNSSPRISGETASEIAGMTGLVQCRSVEYTLENMGASINQCGTIYLPG